MNNKTTKILLTSDFYFEWELYQTSDPEQLIKEAAAMINGRDDGTGIDETTSTLLYSSEDDDRPDFEEIRSQADRIIYTAELYDDDNDDKYLPF